SLHARPLRLPLKSSSLAPRDSVERSSSFSSSNLPSSPPARSPSLGKGVSVLTHGQWKEFVRCSVIGGKKEGRESSRLLVSNLAELAAFGQDEGDLLRDSSPARRAGGSARCKCLLSHSTLCKEWEVVHTPEQTTHFSFVMPVDPITLGKGEHLSPDFNGKAKGVTRSEGALVLQADCDDHQEAKRAGPARKVVMQKPKVSSPKRPHLHSRTRRGRGKNVIAISHDVRLAKRFQELKVDVGGEEAAVRFGSEVDQLLSSETATKWQPMARDHDGVALWRASDGADWLDSCGAPKAPPKSACHTSPRRAPSIASLLTLAHSSDRGTDSDSDYEEEEGVVKAAGIFNERHQRAKGRAIHMSRREERREDGRFTMAFQRSLEEMRRNRFVLDAVHEPFEAPREGRGSELSLPHRLLACEQSSVWYPRVLYSNARAILETPEALRSMFDVDWELVEQCHGLYGEISSLDGEGTPAAACDALADACAALVQHVRALLRALLSSYRPRQFRDEDEGGERCCKLLGKLFKMSELRRIWDTDACFL
ncbi:MAG: hypothetical protein SGPRY_008887, partial [Prymnesium sp.]